MTLRVECVSRAYLNETCIRVIEIDESASLVALHEAIQDAVDFVREHYDFFIANSEWPSAERKWLTEEEEWGRIERDFFRIKLKTLFPLKPRKKLYYLFDFVDHWTFEIRQQRERKEPVEGVTYPRVVEAIGPNPEQYPSIKG
jgi:hypothetical protein